MGEQQEIKTAKLGQDLNAWAEYPIQRTEELRKLAVENGFDPKKVVLGYVFDIIAYDDGNIFSRPISAPVFTPESGSLSKVNYGMRVDWEDSLEEVPEEIRTQLRSVRKELESFDWEDEKYKQDIYAVWKEKVQKWMEKYFDTHPEVKEAIAVYTHLDRKLREGK